MVNFKRNFLVCETYLGVINWCIALTQETQNDNPKQSTIYSYCGKRDRPVRLSMYKEQFEVPSVDTDSAQWRNTDR